MYKILTIIMLFSSPFSLSAGEETTGYGEFIEMEFPEAQAVGENGAPMSTDCPDGYTVDSAEFDSETNYRLKNLVQVLEEQGYKVNVEASNSHRIKIIGGNSPGILSNLQVYGIPEASISCNNLYWVKNIGKDFRNKRFNKLINPRQIRPVFDTSEHLRILVENMRLLREQRGSTIRLED